MAMAFALRCPDRVERLIPVDIAPVTYGATFQSVSSVVRKIPYWLSVFMQWCVQVVMLSHDSLSVA